MASDTQHRQAIVDELVGNAHGNLDRVNELVVLPYVNPMWLANWDAPQLADAPEREVIEEELRDARWRFPQILDS